MRHSLCILMMLAVFQSGCTTTEKIFAPPASADHPEIFVGAWKGEHRSAQGQLLRTWVLERRSDGTYTIQFFHHEEKGVISTKETGVWWIEENRFFETASGGKPDEYDYEVINDDEIRFSSVDKDYVFIDKRVKTFKPPELI